MWYGWLSYRGLPLAWRRSYAKSPLSVASYGHSFRTARGKLALANYYSGVAVDFARSQLAAHLRAVVGQVTAPPHGRSISNGVRNEWKKNANRRTSRFRR